MRDLVRYEWRVNWMDSYGDIQDVEFLESYKEALREVADGGPEGDFYTPQIELCRCEGNDEDGLSDLQYAQVQDGVLGEHWNDYPNWPVPKYLRNQVARATKNREAA